MVKYLKKSDLGLTNKLSSVEDPMLYGFRPVKDCH